MKLYKDRKSMRAATRGSMWLSFMCDMLVKLCRYNVFSFFDGTFFGIGVVIGGYLGLHRLELLWRKVKLLNKLYSV